MWRTISVASEIYASNSVLTTYCSKLLLISGYNMEFWEFCDVDFTFKKYTIKPSNFQKYGCSRSLTFQATSKNKYLIIAKIESHDLRSLWDIGRTTSYYIDFEIYDGKSWKWKRSEDLWSITGFSGAEYTKHSSFIVCCCSDTIVVVNTFLSKSRYADDVKQGSMIAYKFSLLLNEDDDTEIDADTYRTRHLLEYSTYGSCKICTSYKSYEIYYNVEFHKLVYNNQCTTLLHYDQLYFVDLKGTIVAVFFQEKTVPIIWGNNSCHFEKPPHLVSLPDESMLMIGKVNGQQGAQIDVIKVSQKGNNTTLGKNNYLLCSRTLYDDYLSFTVFLCFANTNRML